MCSGPGSKCLGLLRTAGALGRRWTAEGPGMELSWQARDGRGATSSLRALALILAGDYLLGGRTTNNRLRTGTDKGNPTV